LAIYFNKLLNKVLNKKWHADGKRRTSVQQPLYDL